MLDLTATDLRHPFPTTALEKRIASQLIQKGKEDLFMNQLEAALVSHFGPSMLDHKFMSPSDPAQLEYLIYHQRLVAWLEHQIKTGPLHIEAITRTLLMLSTQLRKVRVDYICIFQKGWAQFYLSKLSEFPVEKQMQIHAVLTAYLEVSDNSVGGGMAYRTVADEAVDVIFGDFATASVAIQLYQKHSSWGKAPGFVAWSEEPPSRFELALATLRHLWRHVVSCSRNFWLNRRSR